MKNSKNNEVPKGEFIDLERSNYKKKTNYFLVFLVFSLFSFLFFVLGIKSIKYLPNNIKTIFSLDINSLEKNKKIIDDLETEKDTNLLKSQTAFLEDKILELNKQFELSKEQIVSMRSLNKKFGEEINYLSEKIKNSNTIISTLESTFLFDLSILKKNFADRTAFGKEMIRLINKFRNALCFYNFIIIKWYFKCHY